MSVEYRSSPALTVRLQELCAAAGVDLRTIAAALGVSTVLLHEYMRLRGPHKDRGGQAMTLDRLKQLVVQMTSLQEREEQLAAAVTLWHAADVEADSRLPARPREAVHQLTASLVQAAENATSHGDLLRSVHDLIVVADRKARRSQWFFFGLGLGASIPIGMLINVITR